MAEAFPKATYQKNAVVQQDFICAKGNDFFTLQADCAGFATDAHGVRVNAFGSVDQGKTWQFLCGFVTKGKYDPNNNALGDPALAGMSIPTPFYKQLDGHIRVTLEPIGDNLATKVDFIAEAKGITFASADVPHSAVFDAASSVDFLNVSSASWTHTSAGTPTGVGVGISNLQTTAGGGNTVISSVTFDSVGCTSAVQKFFQSLGLDWRSSIFGLLAPASGAKTVAITMAAACYGAAGAITVTGGDTTTLFSNTASANGTGTPATVDCTSAADELVMDNLLSGVETSVTVGSGQTERWNRTYTPGGAFGAGSTEAGATTVTMSWARNTIGTDYGWALCAASFKAAAGGGGGSSIVPIVDRQYRARWAA